MELTIEFIGFDRPRRLASLTRLATMEIRGALSFDPVPEGTRMRWAWDLQPRGLLKLLTPLVLRLGRRQEQRIWASLKRLLEAEQAPLPSAGRSPTGRLQSPGALLGAQVVRSADTGAGPPGLGLVGSSSVAR